MQFSVRSVFHGERVLDSFSMEISGMKTKFYTSYMKSKYVRITNRIIISLQGFFFKSQFLSIPTDRSIPATYIYN